MATITGYKAMILEARKLMGKAGLLAYDRAKLLVDINADPDFEPEVGGRLKAAQILDELCGDLALKFVRLKQLLQHFPERKQWAVGNLEKMLAEMYSAAAEGESEAAPRVTRSVAKKADLEAAEDRAKHAEAHSKYVEERLETAQQEVERLEAENADLRHKLAVAEGRIAELEKMARRELVAA